MSRRGIAVATVLLAALGGLGLTPARAAAPTRLYLVTLEGPGQPGLLAGLRAHAEQDAVLASVGGPTPVYRWTTAINGVAVPLTPGQATTLRTQSGVALVEPDSVRRLAGRTPRAVGLVPGVERRDR
ncbi:MAG: protease inhibitor I9 family protein, partial [Nocardioidaceae bacterium]|nr:protease inhibitor I9 family protein [Nocardioidaceae bacterium]